MTGELRPRPPSRWAWLFLAGPVIWYTHFWIVYLAAEWGCHVAGDFALFGLSGVAVVTFVLTAIGVGAIVWFMALAWAGRGAAGSDDQPSEFNRAGAILGLIFAIGTLFVGGPALFLTPC